MIEAEIKARLADPQAVRARLDQLTAGVDQRYRDTYFDTSEGRLDRDGYELRVRTVESGGATTHLLTYKEPAVDPATGSKPEYETTISDPHTMSVILTGLGYPPVLAFTKDCRNYRFTRSGRAFLATLVTVPEISGTFLEVETQAEAAELDGALAAVRAVLADLGIDDSELTTATYTDAVRAARTSTSAAGNIGGRPGEARATTVAPATLTNSDARPAV